MNRHAIYHKPRNNYAYFDSPDTVFLLFRAGREDLEEVQDRKSTRLNSSH
jgi:hypothetical protein